MAINRHFPAHLLSNWLRMVCALFNRVTRTCRVGGQEGATVASRGELEAHSTSRTGSAGPACRHPRDARGLSSAPAA